MKKAPYQSKLILNLLLRFICGLTYTLGDTVPPVDLTPE